MTFFERDGAVGGTTEMLTETKSDKNMRHQRKTLSDGSPWPRAMPLERIRWDAKRRLFRGDIRFDHVGTKGRSIERDYFHWERDIFVWEWAFSLQFDANFERVIVGSKHRTGDRGVNGAEYYGEYDLMNQYLPVTKMQESELSLAKEGCVTRGAEYRGISLKQLLDLRTIVRERCVKERWTSTNPTSTENTLLLQPEEVTLYDLMHYFILPVTSERQCSYVELIATKDQPPKWFVSHWWGANVLEFIRCIEGHARDRQLKGSDAVYWVCAYANNQHRLDMDLTGGFGSTATLRDSSFYKAMRLSDGVLSLVDPSAVCYNRIWCSFELFLAFVEFNPTTSGGEDSKDASSESPPSESLLYDAYTLTTRNDGTETVVVGITDGNIVSDQNNWFKPNRERDFPLSLCKQALRVRIASSESSKDKDKRRILNYIRNSNQSEQPPPTDDPSYDMVDNVLRGKFALSSYRRMLEAGEDMQLVHECISKASFDRAVFVFKECKVFRSEALPLMASLPMSLTSLHLDYADVGFEVSDEFAVGLGRLVNLKALVIDVRSTVSTRLSAVERLADEVSNLSSLRELELNFTGSNVGSCGPFGPMLSALPHLEKLKLNFYKCSSLHDVSYLATGVRMLGRLESLMLNFNYCRRVLNEEVVDMCRAVVESDSRLSNISLGFLSTGTHGDVAQKLANFLTREQLEKAWKSFENG